MTVKVFVVDDSKLAVLVAGKAFSALQPDWVLIEATGASEAVVATGKHDVDIVVLDFNVPERDGLQLADNLRARFPSLPIAVLTSDVRDKIIARVRALNTTFVSRPVTSEGLSAFVTGASLRTQQAAK